MRVGSPARCGASAAGEKLQGGASAAGGFPSTGNWRRFPSGQTSEGFPSAGDWRWGSPRCSDWRSRSVPKAYPKGCASLIFRLRGACSNYKHPFIFLHCNRVAIAQGAVRSARSPALV
ncbi:hypothetical protein SD81_034900 [Tolypothrix campylonemoides VB511288]|nr:hypothetical protein SD81_034900 [Tolypothrix campylonemoides VB511288]